jgi:hypothetical protein
MAGELVQPNACSRGGLAEPGELTLVCSGWGLCRRDVVDAAFIESVAAGFGPGANVAVKSFPSAGPLAHIDNRDAYVAVSGTARSLPLAWLSKV